MGRAALMMAGVLEEAQAEEASASFFASAIAWESSASLADAARAGQKLLYLVRPLLMKSISNIYLLANGGCKECNQTAAIVAAG